MAENAVHLSSIEHSKPTIFEIWAEESFMATLQPAFHLLCNLVESQLPNEQSSVLKIIFKWPDECFLAFNFIMQSTYLDWFSASFSEAFYGLKRVNVSHPMEPLTTRAKVLSLLGLVLAPYVTSKLKKTVDKCLFDSPSSFLGENQKGTVLKTYRTLNALAKFTKLYYYVRYLSGDSFQHSMLHKIAGVNLIHQSRPSPSWYEICSLLRHGTHRSSLIAPLVFKIVSQTFELSAFSLQFINWWNSSDSDIVKFNRAPIPEPIDSLDLSKVCPVCKCPWKVEVVLATSGIVYCYSCIIKEFERTGRCPVTGLEFTLNDLIRLYPSKHT